MKDRFIKEYNALKTALGIEHLILATSGGVDSIALAELCYRSGLSFSLAHCNFKLRGGESVKDEQFVKDLGEKFKVEVLVQSFDTESWANENGESIQMAARTLRYRWFQELTVDKGVYLATAHHANDVAETMLFNLAKGTGLAGLHGIPRINNKIIRPLLWSTKNEIIQFAKEEGLSWRGDLSNEEVKYSRNLIRHNVIPELEKLNTTLINSVLTTSARISDAEKAIQAYIENLAIAKPNKSGISIDKNGLNAAEGQLTVLYGIIKSFGFSYNQCEQIIKSIDSVGACFYSDDYMLNIDRETIIVSPIIDIPDPITFSITDKRVNFGQSEFINSTHRANEYLVSSNPLVGSFDLDKLKFPLTIRSYKKGDKFQPLGMTGKKLISDLLIDEKVPIAQKRKQAVVVAGDDIIWLVGRRIDDRYKITTLTKEILELRLESD